MRSSVATKDGSLGSCGEAGAGRFSSTDGRAVWAADSQSFYYIERDDNQRPRWVRRHVLGTDQADDEYVYEQTDDTMFLGVGKSQSGEYVFISSSKGCLLYTSPSPRDS